MNPNTSIPPLRFYVILSFLLQLVFLLVAVFLVAIVVNIEPVILLVFVVQLVIGSLVLGPFGWLLDKGSNGQNRDIALKSIGGVAGMLYPTFAAGNVFGVRFGSSAAGILVFISFYLLGIVLGVKAGPNLVTSLLDSWRSTSITDSNDPLFYLAEDWAGVLFSQQRDPILQEIL